MIRHSCWSARRTFGLGLGIALGVHACSMMELSADRTIGPAGGVVTEPTSGSWLLIPAGALASPTDVSLTTVNSEGATLDNGMFAVSAELALGPGAMTLAKPGALTLKFAPALLVSETDRAIRDDLGVLRRAPGGTWETVPVESTRVVCEDGGSPSLDPADQACRAEVVVRVDASGSYVVATAQAMVAENAVGLTIGTFQGTLELGAQGLVPFGFTEHGGYLYWSNGSTLQRIRLDTSEAPAVQVETLLDFQGTTLRLLSVDASFAYYVREPGSDANFVGRFPINSGWPEHNWAALTSFSDAYPPPPGLVAASRLYFGRQRVDLTSGLLEENPGALSGRYVDAVGCVPSPDRTLALCGDDELVLSDPANPSSKRVISAASGPLPADGPLASNGTHWFFHESAGVPRDEWKMWSVPHGGGAATVVYPAASKTTSGGLKAVATDQRLFVWEGPTTLGVVTLAGQGLTAKFGPLRRADDGTISSSPNDTPSWSASRDGFIGWSSSIGKYLFAMIFVPRDGVSMKTFDFHVVRIDWSRLLEQPARR